MGEPICPICGAVRSDGLPAELGPFCSQRCREVDLNRWLEESYSVPVQQKPQRSRLDEDWTEDVEQE